MQLKMAYDSLVGMEKKTLFLSLLSSCTILILGFNLIQLIRFLNHNPLVTYRQLTETNG